MTEYIIEEVTDVNTLSLADFVLPNENVFLAGGIFKWLFRIDSTGNLVGPSHEKIFSAYNKDFDLFSYSEEGFKNVKDYFELKSSKYYISDDEMMSSYGSYGNSTVYEYRTNYPTIYMDLVHKYFGTPEEILDQFDFTVSQCALYKKDGVTYLIYSDSFKDDLKNRSLVYVSTPDRSEHVLNRLVKYVNYGFKPSADTVKQGLTKALGDSDLSDIAVDTLLNTNSIDDLEKIATILRVIQK